MTVCVWKRCVCVNHLKGCKTSNLVEIRFFSHFLFLSSWNFKFAAEWSRPAELHLTKLSAVSWGYYWRRPVTYLHTCDHLLFRVCFHFTSLSLLVFQNGVRPNHNPSSRISTNLRQPIWFPGTSWRNSLVMAIVSSQCFSGPFTDLFLSSVTEVFLHVGCIPQKKLQWQFWASVLLTSVRQDVVSPSGNTCLSRMLDPLTWSLNLHF